ncbi:hypothetical protein NW249_23710 [Streptomyces sp. OUCMDZ-4982]|uniref:hypothetical protein n=1 Tax=Streptomyces sp. OUCMDZ-4982 TaxID=2973090 RepID=UPI00215BAF1A|nr:hypothetical protein [Streptomyces sp. OUCMDZ-4982]MCR8945128.1 hypothetical protein [Streptomyces sp. OUCMDZ-4982]
MQLSIDQDLTTRYAEGDWIITLTIHPLDGTARLAWNPEGLQDPETFSLRISPRPLTKKAIAAIEEAFTSYDGFDDIEAAEWSYLHNQSRWGWEHGPWWDAVDELSYRVQEAF